MEAAPLRIIGYEPLFGSEKGQPVYNTPITPRENMRRFVFHESPVWIPAGNDGIDILPAFIPDVKVRGQVKDTVAYDPVKDAGGLDMFGVEWVYVPQVGGSMVRPGSPKLEDIESWRDVINVPDQSAWGWEEASERLAPYYSTTRLNKTTIYTGLFERLISFMDFEGAAIAIIDDEQKPYVHEIFEMLTGVYCEMLERMKKYLHIDMVTFHDDWGTQRAPFFSLNTCMEMIVPYLKRICARAHELGMIFELHSCGMDEPLVPAMLEAGVDMWAGQNLNSWEKISARYGGRLIYDMVWEKFDPQRFASKEDFLSQCVEKWKYYNESCPGVWMKVSRFFDQELVCGFFERTYPLSTEMLASK